MMGFLTQARLDAEKNMMLEWAASVEYAFVPPPPLPLLERFLDFCYRICYPRWFLPRWLKR
jgi:hypothetical protein